MTNLPSAEHLLDLRQLYQTDVSPNDRRWKYFTTGPEKAIILPSEIPPVLFRGQTARYPMTYSAMGRDLWPASGPSSITGLSLDGVALLATRLIRRLWFCEALSDHPGSAWFTEQKLQGFEFALAQHYGVPTGYVDLSESFDVSCFFATCRMDAASGEWRPCTEGCGVMYLLPIDRIPIRPEVLQPIGLQMLPRPCEQFGWVIVCGIDTDFESLPGLEMFEFAHSEAVSRIFLDQFDQGRSLFPPDSMADVADRIVKSRTLPKALAESVAQALCEQTEGLQFDATNILTAIEGRLDLRLHERLEIFDARLRDRAEREWGERSRDFLRNVGFSIIIERPDDDA